MFAEAHRLLAPGGITLHDGVADPWVAEAGFLAENFFKGSREPVYLKGQLPPITLVGSVHE